MGHRLQRAVIVHVHFPEARALGGAAAGDEVRAAVPGPVPEALMRVPVKEHHRAVADGVEQRPGVEEA
jgi:hypothetical protein